MTITSQTAVRAATRLSSYLLPRLDPNARNLDFIAPLFSGITDQNYAANINGIVERVVELTTGRLAFDGNVAELTDELRAVAPSAPTGVPDGGYPESVIQAVLAILRPRITSSELMAAEKILRGPSPEHAAQTMPSTMGEDSRYAGTNGEIARRRIAPFAERFPESARLKKIPDYRPEVTPPRPNPPSDPSVGSIFDRFPGLKPMRHV